MWFAFSFLRLLSTFLLLLLFEWGKNVKCFCIVFCAHFLRIHQWFATQYIRSIASHCRSFFFCKKEKKCCVCVVVSPLSLSIFIALLFHLNVSVYLFICCLTSFRFDYCSFAFEWCAHRTLVDNLFEFIALADDFHRTSNRSWRKIAIVCKYIVNSSWLVWWRELTHTFTFTIRVTLLAIRLLSLSMLFQSKFYLYFVKIRLFSYLHLFSSLQTSSQTVCCGDDDVAMHTHSHSLNDAMNLSSLKSTNWFRWFKYIALLIPFFSPFRRKIRRNT